jgi:hypothetical protein
MLTFSEAKKQIALEDYLASLGYFRDPKLSNKRDLFYLSPLPGRNEKTPSFKVDRLQNLWYDHGIGVGGSIIDFVMMYYGCTLPQVLERLTTFVSFHRPALSGEEQLNTGIRMPDSGYTDNLSSEEKKIRVTAVGPIQSPALHRYLDNRKVPLELAQTHCREVQYKLYGKLYYAIGFANDTGGYELRNPYFKGSSSPKGSRFIDNGEQQVAVFEGFFSFLSFLTLHQYHPQTLSNFLVLNSLSFFEKSRPLMEKHRTIHLYLDRDNAGLKRTAQAIKGSHQYRDCSQLYLDCKDFNGWLIQNILRIQQEAQAFNRTKEVTQNRYNSRIISNNTGGHRL